MECVEHIVAELAVEVGPAKRERVAFALGPQRAYLSRVDIRRFVQPEARIQRLEGCAINLLLVIVFVEWPTRRLVHEKERDQAHEEQHWDSPKEPTKNKGDHVLAPHPPTSRPQ